MDTGAVRIGELARRTGVSPELLRAWEQRYGLLAPSRSPGGFRLYGAEDERRVRAMRAFIGDGLGAAEAAAKVLRTEPADGDAGPAIAQPAAELRDALDAFDGERAHDVLDRLFAMVSIEVVLADVLVPYLRELGDRWERGEATVAQEHFASNLLRGRLLGLARGWSAGTGPPIVLACPPGEEHDLGLIMFGIVAARRGRSIVFLGADTPIATIEEAVAATRPDLVVLAASRPETLRGLEPALSALASHAPLRLCGRGASDAVAHATGAQVMDGGPVEVARAVA